MNTRDQADPVHLLGHNTEELRRLSIQHQLYGPFTRQFLVDAGLAPGMKVLDVGSGAGDVSMLAAELVGGNGKVIGVETNPQSVATARARVGEARYENIRFELGDVREAISDGDFDAVIGRFILMWVDDPVVILRRAKELLSKNGIVAFQESELSIGPISFPETPLIRRAARLREEMTKHEGPEFSMGYKLYKAFVDAGLSGPQLVLNTPISGRPDWVGYEFVAETVRSLLPMIQELGVVGSTEIDIDTLAQRIRDEVIQANGVTTMPPVIGAWSRKE